MKSRVGYVSNSSSSSFVLLDGGGLDSARDAVRGIFRKLIDGDRWYDGEGVSEAGMESALANSYGRAGDRDLVRTYVVNELYSVMDAYGWYVRRLLEMRGNGICIGCPELRGGLSCSHSECDWSDALHGIGGLAGLRRKFGMRLSEYPLGRYPRRILRLVRSGLESGLKMTDAGRDDGLKMADFGTGCLDRAYEAAEAEADAWMAEHPKACVLEFASDSGDRCEAVMREGIWRIADAVRESGSEGFVGENS